MELNIRFNKLLIMDFSHALHRNISLTNLWEMRDNYGRRTGAVFGSLNTLLKECNKFSGYFPVAVFDGHLSQRRLSIYENYKNYKDKNTLTENYQSQSDYALYKAEERAEYIRQRELVKEILIAFGVPVIHLDDWEGDDLIYALVAMTKDSIIVSDDKDMLQLLDDAPNHICKVHRGMCEEFWDVQKLKTDLDMTPSEFIACKAILGDTSDNIPKACADVGDKTVLDLYKLYMMCTQNNKPFPVIKEQLSDYCNLYGIAKRSAYLNFNENQFLVNLLLMDLSLVKQDLDASVIEVICNAIDTRELYVDYKQGNDLLLDLNIQTYNVQGLLNNLYISKPNIYVDNRPE